ncbi:HAMP domain-containing histidine kinase [PVC group bacterium]|nr:HAMP domain-containing histidine kinase [PVC group bacterium]
MNQKITKINHSKGYRDNLFLAFPIFLLVTVLSVAVYFIITNTNTQGMLLASITLLVGCILLLFTLTVTILRQKKRPSAPLVDEPQDTDSNAQKAIEDKIFENISHELRTPLVSIRGYTNMLLAQKLGPLTEAQSKCLETCRKGIDHLTRMITQLIDLSRMKTGDEALHIESVHLPELIHATIQGISPDLNAQHIKLTKNIKLDFPMIEGDARKLSTLLYELLNNAIKHNIPSGEITINVMDSHTQVTIEIVNTCLGVDPEHFSKLFKPFYQDPKKSSSQQPGLGLGLTLAKEIIHLHHGHIHSKVESNSKVTLSFTLPKNLSVLIQKNTAALGHASKNTSPA